MQTVVIVLPILGTGLIVGLVLSLLQAVMQVQEQTITIVPKIIAMVLVTIACLGWIAMQLADFARTMFTGG
jgi:flagellar biosynthetic protein FliQ